MNALLGVLATAAYAHAATAASSSMAASCPSGSGGMLLPASPSPPPSTAYAFNSMLSSRQDELASAALSVERSTDAGLELNTPLRTYVLHERILNWNPALPLEIDDVGLKERTVLQDVYDLRELFAGGSCGEVWLAYTVDRNQRYVLKRVFSERGERFVQAGMREVYFGMLLKHEPRVSRFIEAFNRTEPETERKELWLVFEDEGRSLKSFLYRTSAMGLIKPSEFWHRLRTQQNGPRLRRELIRHVVLGLDALVRRGITHRDIKPSNIFITPPRLADEVPVKIGDFGSAVDETSMRMGMFGPRGPSREEHTKEYEPPEAATGGLDAFTSSAFDAWSMGAVCLEVLLGTDQFFFLASPPSPASPASAKASHRRRQRRQNLLSLDKAGGFDSLVDFNKSVVEADALSRGFYDDASVGPLELDFVFRLLQPREQRMTIEQAVEHPYVAGVPLSGVQGNAQFQCSCGRLFSAHSACHAHAVARKHEAAGGRVNCRVAMEPRLAEHCPTVLSPPAPGVGLCGDIGGRFTMEDAGAARGNNVVVVADGHNGDACARFAVRRLLDTACDTHEWHHCVSRAMAAAQAEWKLQNPGDQSGAAVTLLKKHGGVVLTANVGDVRAIACCRANGEPVVLTVDHVASNASEAALVRARGGVVTPALPNGRERVNGRIVLTRSLGDQSLEHVLSHAPWSSVLPLEASMAFAVVASDGVWDALSTAEVARIGRAAMETANGDARRVAARIVLEARARSLTMDSALCAVMWLHP